MQRSKTPNLDCVDRLMAMDTYKTPRDVHEFLVEAAARNFIRAADAGELDEDGDATQAD